MSDWTPNPAVSGAVVDGVNVDAVAAAALACPAVEHLHSGPPLRTATYLPGRRVEGIGIEPHAVRVQVRARWGVPVVELATQIRVAIAAIAPGRRIDVMVADIGDPPTAPSPAAGVPGGRPSGKGDEVEWTTASVAAGCGAVSSSATTTRTVAATPIPSSPAWPDLTN